MLQNTGFPSINSIETFQKLVNYDENDEVDVAADMVDNDDGEVDDFPDQETSFESQPLSGTEIEPGYGFNFEYPSFMNGDFGLNFATASELTKRKRDYDEMEDISIPDEPYSNFYDQDGLLNIKHDLNNEATDGSDQKVSPYSDKDGRPTVSKGRLKWTTEMDDLLIEGVRRFAEFGIGMWKKVAEFVQANIKDPIVDENGNIVDANITNHQCGERYKHHLDPSIQNKKKGPWTDEEIDMLFKLVMKYQSSVEGFTRTGRSKNQINWVKVSTVLNRNYRDCQHKWTNVSKSSLKSGAFTKEEEDYLLRRVVEWGDSGPGVWTALEKEMGRRNRSIQDKYNRLMKKRKMSESSSSNTGASG